MVPLVNLQCSSVDEMGSYAEDAVGLKGMQPTFRWISRFELWRVHIAL